MDLRSQPSSGQAGDADRNYEALVKSHRTAFQRLARRLARDSEDAEDLLQETLVDAYRAFKNFRTDSHFYSWVARIMTNNHLDRLRRKQHRVVSLDQPDPEEGVETLDLPDESANPERLLLSDRLDQPFERALERLQPIQRATVLLCDLDGVTYEEAAQVEECPIGTIRSRLHRAHKVLRSFLSSLDPRPNPEMEPLVTRVSTRRGFLFNAMTGAAALTLTGVEAALAGPETVRVLVWSEGSAPSEIYPEDINAAIAEGLRTDSSLLVKTASLSDPDQGLSDELLRETDVLIWWGDKKEGEVREDRVAAVVRRVRDEGMGFIAAHSGHRCPPLKALLGAGCGWKGGHFQDGSPVTLEVTAPRHPIAQGVEGFRIPQTERCEGELEVPRPEILVFDGTYEASQHSAWQGMVWTVGKGRIFYFQPGHESYPIYYQEEVRQVFRNAACWCARMRREPPPHAGKPGTADERG